ncbi:MAG: hypothetical protein AB8B93_19065 [Pseudomonadales bacterium]
MVVLIAALLVAALSAVSFVHFRLGRDLDPKHRIAASVHGLALALVIVYGLLVEATGLSGSSGLLQVPVLMLLLVCVGSIAYSCWCFRSRWPYLLLHLLAIVLMMPTMYWVGVTVVGWK